jgi:hypothetical protein
MLAVEVGQKMGLSKAAREIVRMEEGARKQGLSSPLSKKGLVGDPCRQKN